MSQPTKIVVLIDPSQSSHPALSRAMALAASSNKKNTIEMVFLITGVPEQSREGSYFSCSGEWVVENIVSKLGDLNVKHSIVLAWGTNWNEVVLNVSKEHEAALVILPFYGRSKSYVLSDEKWKILRNTEIPVLIAIHDQNEFNGKVLCAVKAQSNDYTKRNERVMRAAENLEELFDLEVHAVNAYTDSLDFPDRDRILKWSDIRNEHIHINHGAPQDLICKVAEDIGADLVIIASQRRKGLKNILRGNTVEKIVSQVGRDVLVV